jgi:hypothetical protein
MPVFFKMFHAFMRRDILKTLSFKDSGKAEKTCPLTSQQYCRIMPF